MPVLVEGTAEYRRLAGALKVAERDMKNRVRRSIRTAARPLGKEIIHEGAQSLPQGGGLADRVSGYRAGISQTGSGVQLVLRRLKHYDEGFVRHPVFGNRKRWVRQGVAPYKFSNAFYKRAPAIREVVNKSVQEALNEVARSV